MGKENDDLHRQYWKLLLIQTEFLPEVSHVLFLEE